MSTTRHVIVYGPRDYLTKLAFRLEECHGFSTSVLPVDQLTEAEKAAQPKEIKFVLVWDSNEAPRVRAVNLSYLEGYCACYMELVYLLP